MSENCFHLLCQPAHIFCLLYITNQVWCTFPTWLVTNYQLAFTIFQTFWRRLVLLIKQPTNKMGFICYVYINVDPCCHGCWFLLLFLTVLCVRIYWMCLQTRTGLYISHQWSSGKQKCMLVTVNYSALWWSFITPAVLWSDRHYHSDFLPHTMQLV